MPKLHPFDPDAKLSVDQKRKKENVKKLKKGDLRKSAESIKSVADAKSLILQLIDIIEHQDVN